MKSPARKLFRIGCLAGCLAFAQHAVADSDWDAARHARTDWVFASMKESDVRPTLDRTLKDQVRWRAAREGDPVAQMEMADLFEKLGKTDLVTALRACATQQNPELK
ncbi:hypothetical protein OEJ37_27875 [Burkholderia sp. BKH01]|uniref:hypothetical protein n=1 Tax=Burkholderia sp. BKH01 TaxID=2769262 RepID=UPI0021E09011|nr:hypothetical protein [Burkholderia sp. BKH01]MCU9957186.1 hypothetical protein [Burkholderia sp. BKH01]